MNLKAGVLSNKKYAKFSLGQTIATPNALSKLTSEDILKALDRHVAGDWGETSKEEQNENEHSLKKEFRLLSIYRGDNGTKFWILTEADRSLTTVLLPEDY
ncbi:MAG: hypothetical protein HY591_07110 [Candidatus Omnitrophica bacterium]|nr:hypothetical protein [Candidatus Omnitrophota bacterium]